MLSGPIWRRHEVSLWSLFLSRDRMVLVFDLVGSRARGALQAYKTVLGETFLLGRRQYNRDGKLNEAGGSHCLPSWSHTLDLAKNVTRMWTWSSTLSLPRLSFFCHSLLTSSSISLSFSPCLPPSPPFPLHRRLQSFSGGLGAFSTLHQVLCYFW